jgi:branched-chain amino acid transport system permease protein
VEFGALLVLALMEGTVMAAVLALTAVGLSPVFGVMGLVDVAHGAFFMPGAVAAWFVTAHVPGPTWPGYAAALLVAPGVVAGVAALADRGVLRRLGHEPEAVIVATIGLLCILQQAALTFCGPDARPVPAPFNWRIQLPWFGWSGYTAAVILAAGVILVGVWLVLTRTRAGLVMRATQIDRERRPPLASTRGGSIRRSLRRGRRWRRCSSWRSSRRIT